MHLNPNWIYIRFCFMYSDPRKQINRSRRKKLQCFSTFRDQILDSPGSGIFSVRIRNTEFYLRFVYVSFHVSTVQIWIGCFFYLQNLRETEVLDHMRDKHPIDYEDLGNWEEAFTEPESAVRWVFLYNVKTAYVRTFSSMYRYFSVCRFYFSYAWISQNLTCRIRAPVWHIANLYWLPVSVIP